MKQVVIVSGKGGTGKTVITGAFAALAKGKVMADCDVDAPDLHLLLQPSIKERHEFRSGKTARIDKEKCVGCGKCIEICRFKAISQNFVVDGVSCEGCAFCSFVCPAGAINMEENISGEWFVSDTRFGSLIHARLGIAEENSGKLVSLVRKKAREMATVLNTGWVIIDGSPGIGCPVIASFSGVDYAIVVTEPTLSGLHDADRVIGLAKHFNVSAKLIINKYDLNKDVTGQIERYCGRENIELIGRIPFDKSVVEAMIDGKTVIEYAGNKAVKAIVGIWERLEKGASERR